MPTIYIDADACPVKDETYRVATRYGVPVVVVANSTMRVPAGIEIVVRAGFGAADDYIAEVIESGDICVTADIPLAGRCLEKCGRVLDPRGRALTENDIGAALAMRELNEELRQYGERTGGPPPMTPRDRSRFLGKLDEMVNAMIRGQ
ncbi:MAG TPA: YaiI/YqxD family protein [Gemmataceae bacterium]|nr:YaiI/YqxD family protein [Gemmataceae bacterium]